MLTCTILMILMTCATCMSIVLACHVQTFSTSVKTGKIIHVKPQAKIPISDILGPYQCVMYGPLYLNKEENVRITVTWYPSYEVLVIGLLNYETGKYIDKVVAGGYTNTIFKTWATANYYIFICNDGPLIVYYSGSIEV